MGNSLKGRKLLVLGANPETVPLIKTAQALGVYVLVTDYNVDAYAKQFADKAANVDGVDVNGLIELARSENIDGVLVGVADKLIKPYQELCEKLDLPCYCTKEQVKIFTDKELFNKKCLEYKINTIPFYELNKNPCYLEKNSLTYPIVVKPVDGCSGKGMSVCKEPWELGEAIKKAKDASQKGRILIEKYMDCEGVGIYYTFKDGEYFISAIYDRYTCKVQGNLSQVPLGGVYPSKFQHLFIKEMHPKFCSLFSDLNVRNGVLMISAFVEKGAFYVYDPGLRLQGEAPDILIEAINGFDQKAMLVRFALTGSMGDENLNVLNDSAFEGKYAASVWYLAKEGTIANILGLDIARSDPNVVAIVQRFDIGDTIKKDVIGTEGQVVLRLYITCNSKTDLINKVSCYQNIVQIDDVAGNSLVMDQYSIEAQVDYERR